jgi:antitoxin component of MazEF toxin-antitoxin module
MSELPIVSVVGSSGVVLPMEVLEAIGLRVGDEVNVSLGDRELILRPAGGTRRPAVEQAAREVLEHRKDAYRRLA